MAENKNRSYWQRQLRSGYDTLADFAQDMKNLTDADKTDLDNWAEQEFLSIIFVG